MENDVSLAPETQAPVPFAIPYEEFDVGLVRKFTRFISREKTLPSYHLGEHVSRANFVPMLIDSFAKSRGSLNVQYAYLRWLEKHTGFDWEESFASYSEAGGWKCLTLAERHLIKQAVNAVKTHKEPLAKQKVGKSFDEQLENLWDSDLRNELLVRLSHDLKVAITLPKDDFIRKIQIYLSQAKEVSK